MKNQSHTIITPETVLKAIKAVIDPQTISGLRIDQQGNVIFCIHIDPTDGAIMEEKRQQAEKNISALSGVGTVRAILTAEKQQTATTPQTSIADPHGTTKNPPLTLPIKRIIAVASGKGGVGKSTIAINLAAALARKKNHKVGILDADIYGPSIPTLTGLPIQKPDTNAQGKLMPFSSHGLKIMSIGFLVQKDSPMIWRGPMVQSAIYQMLRDVEWGSNKNPLDTLIIDMPPGTGDAQLTLAQKVNVTGAIIVSTPQDLALMDARKAITMFEKTNIPIMGLIENMSTHICTACGHEETIFGAGGGKKTAQELNIPFLGQIPLSADIRIQSDNGKLPNIKLLDDIAQCL